MSFKKPIYVIASGGTGGHLFPALSLGEELSHFHKEVWLVTDKRGEKFLHNTNFNNLFVCNIRRSSFFMSKILFYVSLLWQIIRCALFFFRLKPRIVIGFGGYPSLPPVLAAQILGIKTIIHEQNAFLGRANRLLAKRAKVVAVSFPDLEKSVSHAVLTGNPVRSEIVNAGSTFYQSSAKGEPFHLFIVGGSQGAKIFSEIIPQTLIHLPLDSQQRLIVTQQCRAEFLEQTKSVYRQSFIKTEVQPYFENIADCYKSAHLIISRSGASTVAELTTLGRPTIFVPFKAAAENHQWHNAQFFVKNNAAWMIEEKGFSIDNLSKILENLTRHPGELDQKAINIRKLKSENASVKLANTVAQTAEDLLFIK